MKAKTYTTPKACYRKVKVRKLTKAERANDIEQERLDRLNGERLHVVKNDLPSRPTKRRGA